MATPPMAGVGCVCTRRSSGGHDPAEVQGDAPDDRRRDHRDERRHEADERVAGEVGHAERSSGGVRRELAAEHGDVLADGGQLGRVVPVAQGPAR